MPFAHGFGLEDVKPLIVIASQDKPSNKLVTRYTGPVYRQNASADVAIINAIIKPII
jgi:hypothetical protein